MPGEIDRYNMQRQVSMTANVAGTDLGSVSREVSAAIARAGDPPRGVKVEVRGQIPLMRQMLGGLGLGLGLAVVVIFLLLSANFQSLRLALVTVSTAPAAIAGVAVMLWLTGTTLNIQSLIGAIMAVGVAMANAILLVTFAEHRRRQGPSPTRAAVEGAGSRLRPILMTTCAMMAGMLPMALALGEAGQQNAPLGRAVIGGLARRPPPRCWCSPRSSRWCNRVPPPSRPPSIPTIPRAPTTCPLLLRKPRKMHRICPSAARVPLLRRSSAGKPLGTLLLRSSGTRLALVCCGLLSCLAGCQSSAPAEPEPAASSTAAAGPPLRVTAARPLRKTLRRESVQPGTIVAFEHTPLWAKLPAYVQKVYVDIGDRVEAGKLLADLWIPELEDELHQKEAQVLQARAGIEQAAAALQAAEAAVATAQAKITEAEAGKIRAEGDYARWTVAVRPDPCLGLWRLARPQARR